MAENASAGLASSGAALAHALQRRQSLRQALTLVAQHAAAGVPGTDFAGVAVSRRDGRWVSLAQSHADARHLDAAQIRLGEGPVPDSEPEPEPGAPTGAAGAEAGRTEGVLNIADTATGCRRWPRFAAAAGEFGVRSLLVCRMRGGREQAGAALSLYARRPAAFDEHAEHTAALYGGYVSLTLFHATLVDSLKAGLVSRQSIGEATGILMERYRTTSPEAFGMLVGASQRLNTKLRDIALRVLETDCSPQEFTAETNAETTADTSANPAGSQQADARETV